MEIGDACPYTFESGETILYRVCTFEELRAYLEHAKDRGAVVRSFDDPYRRVVGWCAGDHGRGLTLMEIKEKRGTGDLDDWWADRLNTVAGRAEIAACYSTRGS